MWGRLVVAVGVAMLVPQTSQARHTTCDELKAYRTVNPAWSDCRKMGGHGGYDPEFKGGDDNDQPVIVYQATPVAPAKRRLQLLIYFHGGGGMAAKASQFLQRAAQAGYDAIGIDYHGWGAGSEVDTPPADLCGCNTDCYGRWFDRQWQGGSGSGLPNVPESSSVQSRLYKILNRYKNNPDYPKWNDYLDAQNHIDWSKLVLVGHSQGTGLATYIAKIRAVDRVILFSGLQWTLEVKALPGQTCPQKRNVPPAWMTEAVPWKTGKQRFWAFVDTKDGHYERFVTVLSSPPLALDKLHDARLPDGFTCYPSAGMEARACGPVVSNPCNDFNGYHVIKSVDLCNCEPAREECDSAHNATLSNDHCSGQALVRRYQIWDHLLSAGR